MMDALSSRDRRALAIGAALVLGLVVSVRGVPAWWRWRAEARTAATAAIARSLWSEGVVNGFAVSLDSLEARTARMRQLGPVFLTADTPAEAAATLSGLVGDVARGALVRIDAIDIHIDSTSRAFPRMRAEMRAGGDIAGLAALLEGLEKGPALLAVRRLSVRPQSIEGSPNQPEMLTLRFTVEGIAIMRPRGGSR